MTDRPALALVKCSPRDPAPARQEAINFARHLARQRVRAMMAQQINDSAPRNR
jgi:hypothetical protein